VAGQDLPESLAEALDDVAIVTCYGRGAVPRNGYGRREIEGMAVVEEPPRLTGQLVQLAHGLLALGLDDAATLNLCRRAALDSMPEVRRATLDALARAERLTVSEVARFAKCDRKVARFALEDLAAIGLTDSPSLDDEDEDPRAWRLPHPWWLAGEDAQLVRDVMTASRWDEKWGPPPHPPKRRGKTG
jgi:hypothetical protein